MKTMDGPWAQPQAMPGWGIVADLTPPELIASRRVRSVRRLVVGALVLVVLLCAGGYVYAIRQNDAAADGLAAEQVRTASLLAEQHKYSAVTTVRGSIGDVQSQLAGLMAGDVDAAGLVAAITKALPAGMTIDQMAVTVTSAGSSASGSGSSSGTAGGVAGLDLSGAAHIGTVTLSGTGRTLSDLAGYVAALGSVRGVFSPYPLSNQTTESGTSYSLQLTLTDALLTHRYDAQAGTR